MGTPRQDAEREENRARALRLAAGAVERWGKARRSRDVSVRFAAEEGASIDEIVDAVGLSEAKVKRILSRRPLG